ncbi:MAG TPA: hypothetical protein VN176_13565 [Verrucomicrobiae bacterium]|jgi:hypothetical protein|nr:hypothetical protein [Verrucomicrobiae bacterium]
MSEDLKPPSAGSHLPGAGRVAMSEEFDRAKWTLPPLRAVFIGLAIVAIVAAVVLYATRAKPIVNSAITKVVAIDQSSKQGGDNVLVAVQMKFDNLTGKQLWIREITSELETNDGKKYTDSSAPKADLDRYLSAFPALAEAKADPLGDDLKIPAGQSFTGMTAFSYSVNKDVFDARKSLTVKIRFYDWPSLVLKQ